MQESPLTPDAPEAPEFPAAPQKTHKNIGIGIVIGLCVVLLLLTASLILWLQRGHTTVNKQGKAGTSSITLYYRDGKTVLWDSKTGDSASNPAPAFAAYVKNTLAEKYSQARVAKGEWRVTTTLDANLQRAAREQVQTQKDVLSERKAENIAFIAEDSATGQIVSWVGGWNDASGTKSETDYAVAKTEPGTLMLPFVYATYLDTNSSATINTQFDDTIGALPGYPCTNHAKPTLGGNCLYDFDYAFLGPLTIPQALGGMRLVPAVKATLALDSTQPVRAINNVMSTAKAAGMESACYSTEPLAYENQTQCYEAALLGDGVYTQPNAVVAAYATLVNSGLSAPQTPLISVTVDGSAANGQPKTKQAITSKTAKAITGILQDQSTSYAKNAGNMFTTPQGMQTGFFVGTEAGGTTFGAVQFSAQYVVGFWALGGNSQLSGTMEPPLFAATANWLDAAGK